VDWNAYVTALTPRGRLHLLRAPLDPLDPAAVPMIIGQRSASGSPMDSPATIARMPTSHAS
jgi:uncharacterized zinc-type alcohol dehydrogenase-like protein